MRHSTLSSTAALILATTLGAAQAETASLQEAAALASADSAKTLAFSGSGHWWQFGQAPVPGGAWPKFDVSSYGATIDFGANAERVQFARTQVLDGRPRPTPTEQKADGYVSGEKSWNLAPPPGAAPDAAPVAVPAFLQHDERAADIVSTPQGFLKAALANNAELKPASDGVEVSFSIGTNRYVGLIGADNRVASIKTWVDTPVLGDTPIETSFSGYKDIGGLQFPSEISRSEGGFPVLHINVAAAKLKGPAEIAVPANIASLSSNPVTVASEKIGDGVHYLTGGTHHSLAIEEKDHVVLVEAPLSEDRSEALIKKVAEIIPGKPIKYVINSHLHFDHSGGLRTFADAGATLVTQDVSRAYYEKVWAPPRTLHPDRLALSNKAPKFGTCEHKLSLGDERPIEVHHIAGNGHSDDLALVYLPKEMRVVEADACTPAAPGAQERQPLLGQSLRDDREARAQCRAHRRTAWARRDDRRIAQRHRKEAGERQLSRSALRHPRRGSSGLWRMRGKRPGRRPGPSLSSRAGLPPAASRRASAPCRRRRHICAGIPR
jgi:glyoxylase-like metal-dependent hydrolase (beta-lactamase superfamily II)